MEEITFAILKIVVSVVSALVAVYLIPYIRNKTQDAKYANLVEMVNVAVMAAEQTLGAKQGKAKKAEVMEFVTMWLNDHGIKITATQLDMLVEAAVLQLKIETENKV